MTLPAAEPTSSPAALHPPVLNSPDSVLGTARRIANSWRADAAERDLCGRPPRAALAELTASGLLGIRIRSIVGEQTASTQLLLDVIRVLAAADSSLTQVYMNHLAQSSVFNLDGTDVPEAVFREIANGALVGTWGVDRSRSNAGQIPTTIRRTDSGYTVNADRYFCTGLLLSDFALVDGKDQTGQAVALFVPRDSPGLTVNDDWESFGQRNTVSGTSIWRDVTVPAVRAFAVRSSNPLRAGLYKTQNQLFHTAIQVGLWDEAITVARPDISGGSTAIAQRARAHRAAAWALARRAAAELDAGIADPNLNGAQVIRAGIAVDEAKCLAYPQASVHIAQLLRTNTNTAAVNTLDRLWRNARVHSLHDPARWRQYFVGDHHLNGAIPPYIKGMSG